jgi:hypothetical protein
VALNSCNSYNSFHDYREATAKLHTPKLDINYHISQAKVHVLQSVRSDDLPFSPGLRGCSQVSTVNVCAATGCNVAK